MPLLSKNVELLPAMKLSSFRKVALGTWRTAGDPSVYGMVDLEVGPMLQYVEKLRAETGQKITISHLMGKAVAKTIAAHPQVNCVLRLGRLYPRKDVDIFFQVATDDEGKDLSGMTIRNADRKSILEISREMQERVERIRKKGDPDFKRMKSTMNLIPGFLTGLILNLTSFLMYTLNLWTPLLGTPRDPFGSAMITNIGSLGLDLAFVPLVPYSRIPLLIALGAAKDSVIAKDGKPVITPIAKLCVTFDHRLIDGVHASKMLRTLLKVCSNPEQELANRQTAAAEAR